MAQVQQVVLVDDVDGTPAQASVQFTVEGRSWELDLSQENLEAFRADMGRWTAHARRTGVSFGSGRSRARRDPAQSAHIRQWANDAGFALGARGRITTQIEDAYKLAHSPQPRT